MMSIASECSWGMAFWADVIRKKLYSVPSDVVTSTCLIMD